MNNYRELVNRRRCIHLYTHAERCNEIIEHRKGELISNTMTQPSIVDFDDSDEKLHELIQISLNESLKDRFVLKQNSEKSKEALSYGDEHTKESFTDGTLFWNGNMNKYHRTSKGNNSNMFTKKAFANGKAFWEENEPAQNLKKEKMNVSLILKDIIQ